MNHNSRAVLVGVSTASRLPPQRIVVPGAGPTELGDPSRADMSKPVPATPVSPTSGNLLNEQVRGGDGDNNENDDDNDDDGDTPHDDDDEDEQARVGIRSGTASEVDPYANLDSAFGGSSAPSGSTNNRDNQDDSLI